MTKYELVIRQVQISDLSDIARIELECFPKSEAATKDSLGTRIANFPNSFFVAETNCEIIGFINGNVTDAKVIRDEMFEDASLHLPDGPYQAIFGLSVSPRYRNQGVAPKLMNHLIESAQSQNRQGVILTCKEELIPYYSRFGFINKGKSASTHGGSMWFDMMLEF